MAITIIHNAPQTIMPVYNTIAFTVNSSNKTNCAFQYICDIYVNGVYATRLKLFPDNDNSGYATFKVERILEDYVSYDLHQNLFGAYLFALNPNSIVKYQLKFGEEYDSSAQCDVGTTIYPDLTLSSEYYAFNGALQKNEWLSWDDATYTSTSSTSKFLTGFPDDALVTYGSQMTFNQFINNTEKLKVITYTKAGATIGTYTYDSPFGSTITNASYLMQTIGVGPENLNNTTLLTGTQPVITQNVEYYTVQTLGVADAPTSETKTIYIDKRENKYDHKRLWWLGRLGNFDSYTYTLRNNRNVQTSRTEYNKIFGAYSGSPTSTWSYNKSDRGRTTLSVNAQESETYNSDWLSETEGLWMEELFTSPEVYTITTNKKYCFSSVSFVLGNATISLPDNDLEVGENILIDIGEDITYGALNGEFVITAVTGTSITFASPFDPVSPPPNTTTLNGVIFITDFIASLEPVIFKPTTYDEKKKLNIKNINYTIEIDKASAVNTQRN